MASQVAHVDVHSDVVEQLFPDSQEEEVVPWSPDATTTLSSSMTHENVHSLFVELVSSTSGREESPIQQFVAHDDVQHSSPLDPLIPRSIPVKTELVSEMERLDQNESPSIVTQVATSDDHGDRVLKYTHNNPIIQQDLELWCHIYEYDKANAEMPFSLILSKKQKQ